MMTHLLDTCICIFLIRSRSQKVQSRFDSFQVGDLVVSSITEAELRFGADKSADPARNHRQLDQFFLALPVLPFDRASAVEYGKIRVALERAGTPIGPLDLLIAAQARVLQVALVTNKVKWFSWVPNLKVEDWS